MPGRFLRGRPVEDIKPAVVRRDAEHDVTRDAVVVGEQGAAEASPPQAREIDRVRNRGVRHHRVHRTERLDFMGLSTVVRSVARKERDREEGTVPGSDPDRLHGVASEDDFGAVLQRLER
jgi:hypothetical protein